jgi:anti-sigma B factor antagonist
MKWSTRQAGGNLVGEPEGRVDETTWEAFLEQVKAAIGAAASSGSSFVLDLAGLEYMSSRGLRALMIAKREAEAAKVPISLARPNGMLKEIIAISKYDKIFTVSEELEA